MRSRANIKSHPLHPILISLPIGFFVGTYLFDLISFLLDKQALFEAAFYLNISGIAFGLIAAVPGFIDYLHTIPPESSAKTRATKHALINVSMMGTFAVALIYRQTDSISFYLLLAIELVGVTLLGIAGWMGGTLVYRNQIGVDIRYAEAGKWKEVYIETNEEKVEVATIDDLKPNQMKLVHLNGRRIVLARTEDQYVAFDDRCPHKGASLVGGSMMCGLVQCPWHGSQFDVVSGALKAGPATHGITTYKVVEDWNKVYLVVDPPTKK